MMSVVNKKILDKLDKYLTIQLSRSAGACAACSGKKIAKEKQNLLLDDINL
jgi:hypothetical protein